MRIALSQLQIHTLQIQVRLLILPHAEYLLVGILGFEAQREMIVSSWIALELAGFNFNGAALWILFIAASALVFLQQDLAMLIADDNFSASRYRGKNFSVAY